MIRPLMRMKFFLQKPSEVATASDVAVARDLEDTLKAHRTTCVGMAANMIGQHKRIIAVVDEKGSILTMLNPELLWGKDQYHAQEGCLSLEGVRETCRYRRIRVRWEDQNLDSHEGTFADGVAQAIQHEIDHCNGILI